MESNYLFALIIAPFILGLVSLFSPRALQRAYAILGSLTIFLFAFFMSKEILFVKGTGAQIEQTLDWLPYYGVNLELRLNSFSGWMVFLNTSVATLALSLSGLWYRKHSRFFTFLSLSWIGFLNGAFLTTNLVFFYLFFELTLIPALFVIGIWGGNFKASAVLKMIVMSVAGSIGMLVSIFYIMSLHYQATGRFSAQVSDLTSTLAQASPSEVIVCVSGFLLAFLIKLPVFPFHAWLKEVYVTAPMPGTIFMSSIMSKLAAYGLVTFVAPLFQSALNDYRQMLVILTSISIIYAALLAYFQKQPKALLAYSSMSHLGFLALAFFALGEDAVKVITVLSVAHAIGSAGLFSFYHLVEQSVDVPSNEITLDQQFGISKSKPVLAFLGFLSLLMGVALPGTLNFSGEFLSLWAANQVNVPAAMFAGLAVILGAVYLLRFYQSLSFGHEVKTKQKAESILIEIMILAILSGLIIYLGIQPIWIMKG